jgi:hypothetical protein
MGLQQKSNKKVTTFDDLLAKRMAEADKLNSRLKKIDDVGRKLSEINKKVSLIDKLNLVALSRTRDYSMHMQSGSSFVE